MEYSLVIIGAHSGVWIKQEVLQTKGRILLVEPVPYNLEQLKENFKDNKNVEIIEAAISSLDEKKKFYSVKRNSLQKLKKHWASGIGSFDKFHLLNHKTKRFNITNEDIDELMINSLSFQSLVQKYNISSIAKLQLDVEGYEYEILKSINYKNISIKHIVFEKKHFDGTFVEGPKLEEIKKLLTTHGYQIKILDEENILAEKNYL